MALTKCKGCGQEISKKAKACPNCGHKAKPGVLKQTIFGLIGAFVVLAALGAFTDDQEGGSGDSEELASSIPVSQAQFVDAAQEAQQSAAAASNDMARGGIRADRAKAICQALGGNSRAQGWIGEIATIDSNSEGKGVFAVSLAEGVALTTWNNAMSDIGSGTLIEPGTELFNTVSAMKDGDLVKFSGTFFPDDVDCVGEQSITLDGSLDDPEFTMKFESVTPYSAG